MHKIFVLSEDDTRQLLELEEVIEGIENVYKEKSSGSGKVFPLVFHEFEKGVADMDIKSGTLDKMGVYGLKLVSWFGNNPSKGLPSLSGIVMLFDSSTGLPIGTISAEHMTGMRTGAAGAIGAKYLARNNSEVMLMVGSGHQASYQIRAMQTVIKGLKKVFVYDPINFESAKGFISKFEYKLDSIEYIPVQDLETSVANSDIIVTATPSKKPLIMKEWVKAGTHFSCMGSDMSGKQEIDENILKSAKLFTDDILQSVSVGEFEVGINNGTITKEDIICEIGDVLNGEYDGRTSDNDITVFDSTGIGLQDIAAGYIAIQKAKKINIGTEVKF
ncbi:ornithine cyclodeaminase [Acetoanaerobium noterae]|uniref:Ornithine cyclodeaminase n=1 Tax=Acetoanaerobium noterae TaxID=745369 RepID=A0A1T5A3Y7_9FIRM|nr:ornithine cyclodeaminase family protein [Acetoanaerobium noterae]SKB29712.1 ornithine cyclodeaminase [Acetoanaerobium noterae]